MKYNNATLLMTRMRDSVKHIILLPVVIFLLPLFLLAQADNPAGYEIRVEIKDFKPATLYLGRYFNGEIPLVDSAKPNAAGVALLKGATRLPGGVYVLFIGGTDDQLDLLVDQQQQFTIQVNYSGSSQPYFRFRESPENERLQEYQEFMQVMGGKIDELVPLLETAGTHEELDQRIRGLEEMNDSIRRYKQRIVMQHPGSLLCDLLIAMREPLLPDSLKRGFSPADSVSRSRYLQAHYWDGVNFWDSRLAFSPFLPDKLDKYFTEIIDKDEDVVIKEADRLLGEAAASKPMTQLILSRLVRGSMDHYYKWGDAVLIHLFEKYIVNRSYAWLEDAEREKISEKAYFLMGKMTGSPAPAIRLPGMDTGEKALYDMNADYILLGFWDPTCSHCLETLPRLDSAYRASWQSKGLKIYAIGHESDGTREDWLAYIRDQQLTDWVHVYHKEADELERSRNGLLGYLQLYDVWYYPSFYILDSNKRFLAKKLPAKDMFAFIEYLLSGNKGH